MFLVMIILMMISQAAAQERVHAPMTVAAPAAPSLQPAPPPIDTPAKTTQIPSVEDIQVTIAYSYLETKDYKRAFALLVKHVRNKDARLYFTLGQMFENGWGTAVNYKQARGYYVKAAQGNHTQAWGRLGILLLEGLGGSRDHKAAQTAFEKGCQAKDKRSCWQLTLLKNTEGLDPKAADDPEIAVFLFDKGDYETAIPALTQMIDHPQALEALGRAYHFGWGVKKDFAMARQHYTKAFSLQNATAAYGLARLYMQGEGVAKDRAVADYFFEKACDGGHKPSCIMRYGSKR